MHEQFVHVVMEVGVAHKARASVSREVTAHAAGVARGARVEHHTKLVVVDVVSVTPNLPKVVLHVNGQLKLGLDNINQRILRDCALLSGKTTKRHKRVHFKDKNECATYSTRRTRFPTRSSARAPLSE